MFIFSEHNHQESKTIVNNDNQFSEYLEGESKN